MRPNKKLRTRMKKIAQFLSMLFFCVIAAFLIYCDDEEPNPQPATDGDADRIGAMDERGNFVDPHKIMALALQYLFEQRGWNGQVVRTFSTTRMIDRLAVRYNLPVYETPVGFKYVAPLMTKKKAVIGGEESGGYGFRGHVPERDAILAGLYFLDFMAETGKTPSQLVDYLYSKVGPHYYDRRDFHISVAISRSIVHRLRSSPPATVAGSRVTKADTIDGFRFFLGYESWLLIRFSGTEPLVRIYSEAKSLERARELLDEGRKLIGL